MSEIKTPFAKNDFEIIKHEIIYQGIFRVERYHLKHRTFDGNWSSVITREVVSCSSAVAILPYDPERDHVVLIEQFRPGTLHHAGGPWMLEIVAGVYGANETPTQVAIREAEEEANCKILDLEPICEYFVSPGRSNEYLHLFCGKVDASNTNGVFGLTEEHENIRAFTLPANDAFELAKKGVIKTSPAILSLQWLELNRERLKKLWQKI